MGELARKLPQQRDGVSLQQEEQGPTLLVDERSGARHIINPTAQAVWELCDGETTLDEVIAAIRVIFDVTYQRAYDDVEAIVRELKEAGLVR